MIPMPRENGSALKDRHFRRVRFSQWRSRESTTVERVLMALLEIEVNIHYIYSFISRPMGRGALAISIEDLDIAMDILGTRNHKVLSQRDISR
jgi:hypothetical protein